MVDDSQEVRRISWGEFFDFTHIFKSFMMVRRCFWQVFLAFAAIALVQLVGSGMDWTWSLSGQCAQPQDVLLYYQSANKAEYDLTLDMRRDSIDKELASWLTTSKKWENLQPFMELYADNGGDMSSEFAAAFRQQLKADIEARAAKELAKQQKQASKQEVEKKDDAKANANTGTQTSEPGSDKKLTDASGKVARPNKITPAMYIGKLTEAEVEALRGRQEMWDAYSDNVDEVVSTADRLLDKAASQADDVIDKLEIRSDIKKARLQLAADTNAAQRALWGVQVKYLDARRDYVFGKGICNVLMNFERDCFGRAVAAVRRGNIFSGFGSVIRHQRTITPAHAPARPGVAMDFYSPTVESEPVGLLGWIFMMTQGVLWLGGNYPIYAAIFGLLAMSIWALFGGAVTRIAAVYAAREESVSIAASLRFAKSRFFSFLSAPLIPLLLILCCGLLMGLGGLLATLPLGDVAVGVLFILPVVLGCVIAFLSIGVVVGLPLMYPTIAVEGSDSFDAISRSLHYSFTRPWRYALYSLIAAIYGAICYLFVRLFVFVALISTHFFVANGFFGMGTSTNPAPELGAGAGKMDLLWTKPTLDDLQGQMNTAVMGFTETLASFFIHLWVYLLATLVAAFVICMAVNCFTQIYYLLRRRVDAADLDDVYITEPDDEDDILPEPSEEISTSSIEADSKDSTISEGVDSEENPASDTEDKSG